MEVREGIQGMDLEAGSKVQGTLVTCTSLAQLTFYTIEDHSLQHHSVWDGSTLINHQSRTCLTGLLAVQFGEGHFLH